MSGNEHACKINYANLREVMCMQENYSDKLIEEMKQFPPEEMEINGVRLLTKNGVQAELNWKRWEREQEERKTKRIAAIWSALNSAAIILLAIALLSRR